MVRLMQFSALWLSRTKFYTYIFYFFLLFLSIWWAWFQSYWNFLATYNKRLPDNCLKCPSFSSKNLKFKLLWGLFEYSFVNSEIIKWSLIMKQFILIKVTTYLMKVEGGLSAPLLPHHNAASLCFWGSNWKVFSGDVCIRQHMRKHTKVPYIYRTNSKSHILMYRQKSSFKQILFCYCCWNKIFKLFKHCIFPQQKRFSHW